MNPTLARQILLAAEQGGYDVPDYNKLDTLEELEQGDFYLRHARAAVEAGSTDETILNIVKLADAGSGSIKTNDKEGGESPLKVDEPDSAPARLAKQENLPIPPEIQGEPDVLPRDLTKLSDREVRKLSGEYNAILARANWTLGIAQSDVANYTHLRDDEFDKEFLDHSAAARLVGTKATKDELSSMARRGIKVIEYTGKLREAEERVRTFKLLTEIYRSHVDRLSREWTMRESERNVR